LPWSQIWLRIVVLLFVSDPIAENLGWLSRGVAGPVRPKAFSESTYGMLIKGYKGGSLGMAWRCWQWLAMAGNGWQWLE
jgi:hypothetical protein